MVTYFPQGLSDTPSVPLCSGCLRLARVGRSLHKRPRFDLSRACRVPVAVPVPLLGGAVPGRAPCPVHPALSYPVILVLYIRVLSL